MTESSLIYYLFGLTFALAIGYGIYQWWRAKKARREHHHSVAEQRQPETPQTRVDAKPAPASQQSKGMS
jgi:uncharacterized protein HemX